MSHALHHLVFRSLSTIIHQGPLQFYMAKAPSDTKVEEFDGLGDVWFKIASDEPTVIDERLTWPNFGNNPHLNTQFPESRPLMEYREA